ncbi:MAG TPA: hypothetical protein VH092_10455 [Urbifossiella sp.]|jgi:hypothetical protein|nr:hypothetical protein [Urbifossiella sp.]
MPEERQPPADAVYRAEDIKVLPVPDTFFGLLAAVRDRPGMYIGRKSLRDFYAWLGGLQFARMQAKLPPLPGEDEFDGFDAFVCDKYRWHDVGGWAAKIAYYYHDGAGALDQFFALLDEYRAGRQSPQAPRGRAGGRRKLAESGSVPSVVPKGIASG